MIISATVAAVLIAPLAATADTTTFSFESAGCAGGGNACGTFPIGPWGASDYEDHADDSGAIELSASAERGVPVDICLPGRDCEPIARYTAEATGRVWTDVDTPSAAQVMIAADFDLAELVAEATEIYGQARAIVSGALTIVPAPGYGSVTCAGGAAITGAVSMQIDGATETGPSTRTAVFECAGPGLLPPMRWRVQLLLHVKATSNGGMADAEAEGQLTRVSTAIALP